MAQPMADDYIARGGAFTNQDYVYWGKRLHCSPHSALRWLREALEARLEVNSAEFELPLPRELLICIGVRTGAILEGYKDWRAENPTAHPISLSTVRRRINSVPYLPHIFADGMAGLEHYLRVGVIEAASPFDLWTMDETLVPVLSTWSGRIVEKPWLHLIIDDASRLIVGADLTIGPASKETTAALIARAVLGVEHEGRLVEGACRVLRTDNAKVYTSGLVQQTCEIAGIAEVLARPYTPQDKPKGERVNRSIKAQLRGLPGYLHGPKAYVYRKTGELNWRGKPIRERLEIRLHVGSFDELLTFEQLKSYVFEAVRIYNTQRVHRIINSTPFNKALTTPHLVRRSDAAMFWDVAYSLNDHPDDHDDHRDDHKVDPRGIWVDYAYWTNEFALPAIGEMVEVRVLLGPKPVYLVGQKGKFVCELSLTSEESEAGSIARDNQNRVVDRSMRQLVSDIQAATRTHKDVDATTIAAVAARDDARAAEESTSSLADVSSILNLPPAKKVGAA